MRHAANTLIVGLTAFAGGLIAGLLIAPESGEKSRRRLAAAARQQIDRLEGQVRTLERRLHEMEDDVRSSGRDIADRVRTATADAAHAVLPDLGDEDEPWELGRQDVAHSLRRMPRR